MKYLINLVDISDFTSKPPAPPPPPQKKILTFCVRKVSERTEDTVINSGEIKHVHIKTKKPALNWETKK